MEKWPQFYITSKDENGDDIPLEIIKQLPLDNDDEVQLMSSIAKQNAEYAARSWPQFYTSTVNDEDKDLKTIAVKTIKVFKATNDEKSESLGQLEPPDLLTSKNKEIYDNDYEINKEIFPEFKKQFKIPLLKRKREK